MATIINFASWKNERRASAIIANREEQKAVAIGEHYQNAAEAYLNNDFVTTVTEIQAANELKEDKPCPCAYCDPNNEYRGAKYEGTRNLSNTEIAKVMRDDVKVAKKRGLLPKDLKVSVRCEHYTSIEIRITAFPAGTVVYSPEYLEATGNLMHPTKYGRRVEEYTPEVKAWFDTLKEIHNAYNRDNSDSMSDYFDVRYYGSVGIYWELSSAIRKSIQG